MALGKHCENGCSLNMQKCRFPMGHVFSGSRTKRANSSTILSFKTTLAESADIL